MDKIMSVDSYGAPMPPTIEIIRARVAHPRDPVSVRGDLCRVRTTGIYVIWLGGGTMRTAPQQWAARLHHCPWTPDRIRALRVRLGLNQTDMAARLGSAAAAGGRQVWLSRLEAGQRVPSGPVCVILDQLDAPPTP